MLKNLEVTARPFSCQAVHLLSIEANSTVYCQPNVPVFGGKVLIVKVLLFGVISYMAVMVGAIILYAVQSNAHQMQAIVEGACSGPGQACSVRGPDNLLLFVCEVITCQENQCHIWSFYFLLQAINISIGSKIWSKKCTHDTKKKGGKVLTNKFVFSRNVVFG